MVCRAAAGPRLSAAGACSPDCGGARPLGLRWTDIDFGERVVRLPAARTKAGRALDIPMTDFVHALLVARRQLGDAKYVFPSYGRNGHIEDARAWIDAVTAATGIEFSMHDLRRTFLTVAESADISVLGAQGAGQSFAGGRGDGELHQDVNGAAAGAGAARLRQVERALWGNSTGRGQGSSPTR